MAEIVRDRFPMPATEPQLKAVYAIGRIRGLDENTVDGECFVNYGCYPNALSRRQASEFIDTLKGYPPKD